MWLNRLPREIADSYRVHRQEQCQVGQLMAQAPHADGIALGPLDSRHATERAPVQGGLGDSHGLWWPKGLRSSVYSALARTNYVHMYCVVTELSFLMMCWCTESGRI